MKVIKVLVFFFAMQLIIWGLVGTMPGASLGEVGNQIFGENADKVPYAMIALGLIIILITAFSGGKGRKRRGRGGSYEPSFKKPMNTFPFAVAWLVITLLAGYFISANVDADKFGSLLVTALFFVWENVWFFVIPLALWGVLLAHTHNKYRNLDMTIFAIFTLCNYKSSFMHAFLAPFAPIYSKAPLVSCYGDLRITSKRKFLTFWNMAIKFLSNTAVMLTVATLMFLGFKSGDYVGLVMSWFGENTTNYLVCILLLACLPHLDVLLFCISTMVPFFQIEGYLVKIDTRTRREVSREPITNFFALLFMTILMFAYSVALYPWCCANMCSRLKETNRFRRFIKHTGWADDICDYYEL